MSRRRVARVRRWMGARAGQEPKTAGAGKVGRRSGRKLVKQSERYLAGSLQVVDGAGVWLPMSRLAHADLPTLMACAHGGLDGRGDGWDTATAYLASELVALAPFPTALRMVQARALIPLELRLLGGTIPPPRTSAGLVDAVMTALHRYKLQRAR